MSKEAYLREAYRRLQDAGIAGYEVHYLIEDGFCVHSIHTLSSSYVGTYKKEYVTCKECLFIMQHFGYRKASDMIIVKQEPNGTYTVSLGVAEENIIRKIAIGYGIKNADALASVINKGIEERVNTLTEIADYERQKRETQTTEG